MSGPRVIDQHVRAQMRDILADVQSGAFAERWIADYTTGDGQLRRLRQELRDDVLEDVGARLRAMMGWLG